MEFQNNKIVKLFGIQYPIVQGGMVWCSGWKLASAVSNAGGLGLIGAGSMDAPTLREHIQKCKGSTDRPFGVNVPLLYKHIGENIDVILEEGVPIVFSSAGNPKTWTSLLQKAGVKVVHVVSNLKFAGKAASAGCDAIVAEGFEAGGHNGREEITTLCLVPQVRKAVDLPLIAAGGIGTGAGMMAAMALGADGVQMGTRFVAAEESSAHSSYKEKVVATSSADTILALKSLTPVRLIKNRFYSEISDLESNGASREELVNFLGRGRSKRGMFQGELDEGELEIGQIAGTINSILPAGAIVEEIIEEYRGLRTQIGESQNRF